MKPRPTMLDRYHAIIDEHLTAYRELSATHAFCQDVTGLPRRTPRTKPETMTEKEVASGPID